MDPVTHLASGVLVGRLAQPKVEPKHITWYCVAVSWLPDIDNLANFLGPEQYLLYHRGITHSFVGGAVLAAASAGILRQLTRKITFAAAFIVAYLCILIHIFLDLITSYGTLILSPFTNRRFALSSIFIVDPVFTGGICCFLLGSLWWGAKSRRLAAAGLAWLFLYPAASLGIREISTEYLADTLRAQSRQYHRFELTTEPLSPFFWKLVAEDDEYYYLAGVTLFDLDRKLTLEPYAKPPSDLMEQLKPKIGMLQTYLWFSKYPTMELRNSPGGKRLLLRDLRFFSTLDFIRRRFRDNGAPFSLVIELDQHDNPLNWQYRRPGGDLVIQYLE
ncbi:MAG: metal-dependent hydrolase [Candidatus Abyssubacteria bacterium]